MIGQSWAVDRLRGVAPNATVIDRWGLRLRERQVLELLIEGRTNRDIAHQLVLGEETVKTYLRNLYRKLGARDRFSAVAIALGRRPEGRTDGRRLEPAGHTPGDSF